jgi:uncharacterized phage protein (TIGR02218 family)
MKTFDSALTAHLAQEHTTLARCYRLTRRDGMAFGFTSHDQEITLGGLTYRASDGLTATTLESTADFRANNQDIQGVLSDSRITEADILAGLYDYAALNVFLVNWQAVPQTLSPQTVVWLQTARFGEIELKGGQFVAEAWGLSQALERQVPNLVSPTCRATRLGDAACKVNVTAHQFSYNVASIINKRTFTHNNSSQPTGAFRYGIVRFSNGIAAGREYTVKQYENNVLTLIDEAPGVQVGDAFTIIRGCDRRFETCRDVFNNVLNFRGEPPHLLPGTDKLVQPL